MALTFPRLAPARDDGDPAGPDWRPDPPDHAAPPGPDSPVGPAPWWYRLGQALLLVAAALTGWDRLTASPGLNEDGQNLGVFAAGARSLRELGPVASRLGAHVAVSGDVYANHPPLIYWLTAASESAFGVHPWSTRLPTALAAASLVITVPRLLRLMGLGPHVALTGAVAALWCPMYLVYGAMLDTPMLGLAFAVAALGEWVRVDSGADVPATRLLVATALACLASWEAVVLCGLLAVTGSWIHRGTPSARRFLAMVATIVTAVGLTIVWIVWSYGSIDELVRQFRVRAGRSDSNFTARESVEIQLGYLADMFGLPLLSLGVVGTVVGIQRRPGTDDGPQRTARIVTLLVCIVVAGYSALFWQAATYHRYWSYWVILPLGVGVAHLSRRLLGSDGRSPVGRVAMAIMVVGLVAATSARVSDGERRFDEGVAMTPLLAPEARPIDQDTIYVMGFGDPSSWVSHVTGKPVKRLSSSDVAAVAEVTPQWRVLVYCGSARRDGGPPICPRIDDPSALEAGGVVSASAVAVAAAL